MTDVVRNTLLAAALTLAVACQPSGADEHSATTTAAKGTAGAAASTGEQEAAHAHAAPGASDAGASHDAQTLRVIMQGLDVDMQGFAHALFTGDSAQMTARSSAMADHAHMLPEEVRRIEAALGADMAAFTAADERVHLGASRLSELARGGAGLDAVARQLGEVQQGCVACHSQFRERLRTDRQ